jgi:hypothetical protein
VNVLFEEAVTKKRLTAEEDRQGGVVAAREDAIRDRSCDETPEGRQICH